MTVLKAMLQLNYFTCCILNIEKILGLSQFDVTRYQSDINISAKTLIFDFIGFDLKSPK